MKNKKDLIKHILDNNYGSSEKIGSWTLMNSKTSGAKLITSDSLISVVTGEDEFNFEHVFDLRTGNKLGMKEDFVIDFDPEQQYWFILQETEDMSNSILYYIKNGIVKKVKELTEDIEVDNYNKVSRDPEKLRVIDYKNNFLKNKKSLLKYIYPDGKSKNK